MCKQIVVSTYNKILILPSDMKEHITGSYNSMIESENHVQWKGKKCEYVCVCIVMTEICICAHMRIFQIVIEKWNARAGPIA